MAGGGGGGDGEPEFQIAPMIDVLLVLLVFFVTITSAEVLKVDRQLTLPVSKYAKVREAEMKNFEMAVNVRLDKASHKGVLVIDEKVYQEWAEAVPHLQARNNSMKANHKGANKSLRVIIRADEDLPASELQKVISIVAEAGIDNIGFSAKNR